MTAGREPFDGWRVVGGAFVLAVLGWGLGFYGPPIYLEAVRAERGWPVPTVSAAVTTHFLAGALVVASLPRLYRRFGFPAVTRVGSVVLAVGLFGWAVALAPWQLFLATILTGGGWVTMGAAAVNAVVSPWFDADRPKALATAYNGASVGGILFSPLWVLLIGTIGFPVAAALIGLFTVVLVALLCAGLFGLSPERLGQRPDGRPPKRAVSVQRHGEWPAALPGRQLWQAWQFRTLAAGMALGLFAQIGLLAHLFSLIVPTLGTSVAGLVMGGATASAILGRTAFGWLLSADGDRRIAAALSHAIQMVGVVALLLSGATERRLVVGGILLFGFGIGNATSLPPLIAQAEFAKVDTGRVVALIVAMAQATYAFAPAVFGMARALSASGEAAAVFALALVVKGAAITAFLAGRARR